MKKFNKNVGVEIKTQAEKLASLYFLSSKYGVAITESVIHETVRGLYISNYPVVFYDVNNNYITACHTPSDHQLDATIGFSDLSKWDDVSNESDTISVKLNESYTAKVTKGKVTVGCQTFDRSVITKLVEALNKLDK